MRALTLIQPWAHAVCHMGKRVENRSWRPPAWIIGQRIAIHAGAKLDKDDCSYLGIPEGTLIITKAIVATARIVSVYDNSEPPSCDQAKWFFGPFGWHLSDVRVLPEPVPCKGMLGLWHLPPDVERAVMEQEIPQPATRTGDCAACPHPGSEHLAFSGLCTADDCPCVEHEAEET